jgi:hypothetical protein
MLYKNSLTLNNCYIQGCIEQIDCFPDEEDFPALTQSTNPSAPNFWRDRCAFVNDARPATEDEETEMLQRALEESRLLEEERQKKILEEDTEYRRLL